LLLGFAFYVALIFSFAWIYYQVYKSNPSAFFFTSDIQASQATNFEPWARQKLAELSQQREVVKEAIAELGKQEADRKRIDIPYRIALPFGRKLVLDHGATGGDALDRIYKTLSLEDAEANTILSWASRDLPFIADGLWPRKLTAVILSLETESRLLNSAYDELGARLQTLNTSHPHVWYFCRVGREVSHPGPSPDPDKEISTIRLFR
jgi:hypothetical protein